MRNLKRVLALALALVMILGMMVIGSSAASYSDSAAIDEDYVEAVEILTGMGVFEGTDKGFEPKTVLNRASAAALIYRVLTGDVAKKQIGLYDFSTFADVVEGEWYTPYITYAANGGYLKGYAGNAMPYETVTGIQVLAIMLRAAGYGQNGEFEGAGWKDGILTTAKELGVTDGIATNDLDKGASRELVAQLIFNAMTKAKMVSYAPLLGYYQAKDAQTLAEKVFGLTSAEIADDWGRPAVAWYNAKKGLAKGIYVVFPEAPIATYTTAVSQCDIAKDQGAKKDYKTDFYFNGKYVADKAVAVTNTKPTVGAQGTQVEVYADRVVVVDTYLAQVTWLNYEKADKNGHIYQEASMEIKVELGKNCCTDLSAKYVVPGNDYARYTYVLVNINEAGKYAEIIGEAESFEGAQSKIWSNGARHTIDKVDYTDAEHFHMDAAGASNAKFTWFLDQFGNLIGSKEIAAKYGYAVLKDMNWVKGEGAQATLVYMDGTEETVTVNTIDGEWVDGWYIDNALTKLDDQALIDNTWGGVSTEPRYNSEYNGAALYKIEYNKNGSVNLHGIVGRNEVVSYSDYAVIDTSSSVILDGADFGKLFVTTDTEILVREGNAFTGYTYETYTIDTLPEFADDYAEIFYTVKKVYGTTYAVDRLYIKDAALEADFGTHLFTTTNEFYRVAGTNDWHMTVLVDGVEREIVAAEWLVEYLAANTGKLFHAEWDTNPYDWYYGYLTDARLINEAEDDDHNFYGCNYLSGSTVLTSSSLINGGASYRFDANTVVYGAIDSIDELGTSNVNYDGIWVLADPTTSYSRAAVIYVGTKLNTSASADVFYGEGYALEATPDKAYANWTINVARGVESAKAALVPLYNGSVVVDAQGDYDYYWTGTVEVGTPVELTVWNEEGTTSKDFTITVVAAGDEYEWTVVKTTMDSQTGAQIEIAMVKNGEVVKMADATNLTVKVVVYDEEGTVVYTTDNAGVSNTGDGTAVITPNPAHTLTAGAKYKAVVTISGSATIPGANTVETGFVQAQTQA